MTRVLVIGGYGTFGRRLVRLLSDMDGLRVLVGGRNPDKAAAIIGTLNGSAVMASQRVDRSKPLAAQVSSPVDIVVDAVGPFQAYGATRDLVFDYCVQVGATYIDLSDDPAFCAHMMDRAVGAPMTVATGWSTFSAVTGAVVHALGGGASRAGIVPNPHQPMGRAVIDSVLSYAGRPIPNGQGLTRTLHRTVAPPGARPLRTLLFSNVATPDAVLIHPDATGWVAPQPEWLHRILVGLARLVKWKLFPPLTLFGKPIHAVQSRIHEGEARGGLFVEAKDRSFHLIGEGDTGPDVPVIPAAALIAVIHDGETFAPGLLRPGHDFPLDRLTPWFDRIGLDYGMRGKDLRDARGSLYARILGKAMADLPEPVCDLHAGGGFIGRAKVQRGRNLFGRLAADLLGLPKAGDHDLRVSITTDDLGRERWSRRYSGREMLSLQERGRGRAKGMMVERFGPIAVQVGLQINGDRLGYRPRGWSVFGVPLPRRFVPSGETYETADAAGRFRFHVDIVAPGLGRLVHYEGWLIRACQDEA
ncbi:SDR family oxidoreductase [uncultured Algimonas sp.]|uniref:DUF4166 domain-containing protein n=1 Tax=uncultured Algimonas sp. TaxID=1547920 RepID=UPI00261465D7|nr:SDR family oxidoreductase [uncultured Algimonas sp.]